MSWMFVPFQYPLLSAMISAVLRPRRSVQVKQNLESGSFGPRERAVNIRNGWLVWGGAAKNPVAYGQPDCLYAVRREPHKILFCNKGIAELPEACLGDRIRRFAKAVFILRLRPGKKAGSDPLFQHQPAAQINAFKWVHSRSVAAIRYTLRMTYVYHAPILTVDGVIFQLLNDTLCVLLIRRTNEPFKGHWALPGGYNAAGDTTRQALERVLTAKTGIHPDNLPHIEQLYTFDTVARDPRGHAVSVTYMALAKSIEPEVSERTQHPQFFPITKLPKLAYDHAEIIQYAVERLRSRITYTNAVFALLPDRFTLTQLQSAYETILGHALDKRNFRKKFLSFSLLKPTSTFFKDGAHRPALLYKFKHQRLETLVRSFDA
jgi:8-oxo-dGTP diphosphatase